MPTQTIDLSRPQFRFRQDNVFANPFSSIIADVTNLGGELARIGGAHQQAEDAKLWKQSEAQKEQDRWADEQAARKNQADQQYEIQKQQLQQTKEYQDAQVADRQADNVRQTVGMFGTGLNNAAARGIDAFKALGQKFSGGSKGSGGGRWSIFQTKNGDVYKQNNVTGEVLPALPALPAGGGNPTAPSPENPVEPIGPKESGGSWDWLTLRRSGAPGVNTIGDAIIGMTGGQLEYNGEGQPDKADEPDPRQVAQAAEIRAAGAAPVEQEFVDQHAIRIASLPTSEGRQAEFRKLKKSNPALFAAVAKSLQTNPQKYDRSPSLGALEAQIQQDSATAGPRNPKAGR